MISAYENGKSETSIAMLIQMANIFQTSVDYIIGYTNVKQPPDKIAENKLSENECVLLEKFNTLSLKKQHIALGVILGI